MTPTTPDTLDAIRSRLAEITSAPWHEQHDAIVSGNNLICVLNTDCFDFPENERFIAHAPDDIHILLAVVAERDGRIAELERELALVAPAAHEAGQSK